MNKEQILAELAYNEEYKKLIGDQLDVIFSATERYSEMSSEDIEILDISTSREFLFNDHSVSYIYCKFDKNVKDYVDAIQMKLICWQMANHTGKDYPMVVCTVLEE